MMSDLQAPPNYPVIVVHTDGGDGLTVCTGQPMPGPTGDVYRNVPRYFCQACARVRGGGMMGISPDSPRTTNPNTFRSSPPDLDRLREARAWWDDPLEDATYIPEYVPEYDDAISDAIDWLLSLAESGGRLAVETPCEHGVFNDSCDQLVCGHDHLLTDGWYPDARAECWCPGGSRRVIWSREEK